MRSVLITGTSTGFGLVIAVELAKRGWRVFATMRNLERRAPLQEAVDAAGVAERVEVVQLDVTDKASIEGAVAAILERTGGRLDAVVHNAGIAAGGALEDVPEAELRRVMDTNFFGVLALTRALLPTFRAQRAGRIVLISSDAGFTGQPANAIYCASKWALEGWAEAMAYELSPWGIEILLVEPGPYVTDIWRTSLRICPEGSAYRAWVSYVFRAGDAHAATHAGDPREVAVKVADLLEARRPRFRTPVGRIARLIHLLRGKVPARMLRRGVTRYLGLHRVQP